MNRGTDDHEQAGVFSAGGGMTPSARPLEIFEMVFVTDIPPSRA